MINLFFGTNKKYFQSNNNLLFPSRFKICEDVFNNSKYNIERSIHLLSWSLTYKKIPIIFVKAKLSPSDMEISDE